MEYLLEKTLDGLIQKLSNFSMVITELNREERLLIKILNPFLNPKNPKYNLDNTLLRLKEYYAFYNFAKQFNKQTEINEFKMYSVKYQIANKNKLTGSQILEAFSNFVSEFIDEYNQWLEKELGFKYPKRYILAVLKTQLVRGEYTLPIVEKPTVYHFQFWIGLQLLNRYCKSLFPLGSSGEYEFIKTTQGQIRHFLPKKIYKKLLEEAQATIVDLQIREPIDIKESFIDNMVGKISIPKKEEFENTVINTNNKLLLDIINHPEYEWKDYNVKIRCKYNPKAKKMKIISEIPDNIQELEKIIIPKLKTLWYDVIKANNHFTAVKQIRELMHIIRENTSTEKFTVIRTDIRDFYYNIDPRVIFTILKKLGIFTEQELSVLKYLLFHYQLVFDEDQRTETSEKEPIIRPKVGILVGSQLSEWIARLYLRLIEQKIKEKHPDALMTFYMDDILIIKEADLWKKNLEIYKSVIEVVKSLGLELSPQKTQIIAPINAEEVENFCKKINIPEDFVPSVEDEIVYAGITINEDLLISINKEKIVDDIYKHIYAKLPKEDFFATKIKEYDKLFVNQIIKAVASRWRNSLDIKPNKDFIENLLNEVFSFFEFLAQEPLKDKKEISLLLDKYKSYFDIGELTKVLRSDQRCAICTCPKEWHKEFLCKHCAQHYYRENFKRHQRIVHFLEAKLEMKPLQPLPEEPEQDLEHHGHKWDITLVKNVQRLPYAKRVKFSKHNKGTVIAVTPFGVRLFSTGVEDCKECAEINKKILELQDDIYKLAYTPDLYETIYQNLQKDYKLTLDKEEDW